MKNCYCVFIYDRKKVASRSKQASVEIRVTYDGRQKYMSTGVKLFPHQWKCDSVINRFDAKELNELLQTQMRNVRKVVNAMVEDGYVCIDEIHSRLQRLKEEGMTFLEFCHERVVVRQHGLKGDTAERYDRFMNRFEAWGKIKFFSDITERNIIEFDSFLMEMKPYSRWHNYHRFLNSFILDAIADGRLKRNPYRSLDFCRKQEKRSLEKYLTPDEVERIKNVELDGHFGRARDLFLFQIYTCLAYVDLAGFDSSCIKTVRGKKMYSDRRAKTGQEFTFLLLDPALEILDKYDGKLPIISNQKYNDYLKAVCVSAGIRKNVTTHWARHTGATLLLNSGVPMDIVAKVLGHSSTKITREVYAKLLDDTIANEMEKVRV